LSFPVSRHQADLENAGERLEEYAKWRKQERAAPLKPVK
jgi:hypothetical protein